MSGTISLFFPEQIQTDIREKLTIKCSINGYKMKTDYRNGALILT